MFLTNPNTIVFLDCWYLQNQLGRDLGKKNITVDEEKIKILTKRICAYFRRPFDTRFFIDIKKILFNIKKKGLHQLKELLLMSLNTEFDLDVLEASSLYNSILDFFKYKLEPYVKSVPTPKSQPKLVCTFSFINKGIEMIHIPSIFRSSQSLVSSCKHRVRSVAYRYGDTIGPKIFNFKETVSSSDDTKSLADLCMSLLS